MPEGPEVKRVIDFLSKFDGSFLHDVKIISGRYSRHGPFEGYYALKEMLPLKIVNVNCQGKFIYFYFENDTSLWCTLGMSGAWLNHRRNHARVELKIDNSQVWYDDVRNFGTLKFVTDVKQLASKLGKLGHDPLKREIDCKYFKERVKKKKNKTIAEVLMKQDIIAGIGNYLKAEILYASQVSPHRSCDSLSDKELHRICKFTNEIMSTSYSSGGATILTYKDENGNPGTFSRRFMVYNQKEDPLGNRVIRETTKDKRTTHWVPEVQK